MKYQVFSKKGKIFEANDESKITEFIKKSEKACEIREIIHEEDEDYAEELIIYDIEEWMEDHERQNKGLTNSISCDIIKTMRGEIKMKRAQCESCKETLVEENSENLLWDSDNGIMERVCWGFCPRCGKGYEWKERYSLVEIFDIDHE